MTRGLRLLPLLLLILAAGCGKHRKMLNGEEPVTLKEFTEAFPQVSPPWILADTALLPTVGRLGDSARIGYDVFTQFIPDSFLNGLDAKDAAIYPLGRIARQKDQYLVAAFAGKHKKATTAVFFMSEGKKCMGVLTALKAPSTDGYSHTLSVNREPTFSMNRDRITQNNQLLYTHKGLAFSKTNGRFIQVISDTNEDTARNNLVQDPIDTLPKHNKFSGNYSLGRKNFVSIRDGRNAQSYQFFIHFEKEEDCSGELKGELVMKDARTATFHRSGDPCVIEFTFNGTSLAIREQGNCGNHRGLRCPFDDVYPKRKEPRSKISHKKPA